MMERERIKAMVREALTQRLAPDPKPPAAAPSSSPAKACGGTHEAAHTTRDLVCEEDVLRVRGTGEPLLVCPGTLITPLARETAVRYGVDIVERAPASTVPADATPSIPRGPSAHEAPAAPDPSVPAADVVALGCDHGGFALKETLRRFLEEEAGYVVVDFGTHSGDSVDYPEFAHKVAGAVSRGEAARGIVIDGMGLGSAMAANRHAGVRAAPVNGIMEAMNAREHNDANVLCLGGRMVGDLLARAITMVFLTTEFAGGRHQRRVSAIEIG